VCRSGHIACSDRGAERLRTRNRTGAARIPMIADDAATREMVLLLTGYLSYRALRARRDDLGMTLRPDEAARLAELENVFGDAADGSDRALYLPQLHERSRVRLPVEYRRADGAEREGLLVSLSPGDFFVETAEPL